MFKGGLFILKVYLVFYFDSGETSKDVFFQMSPSCFSLTKWFYKLVPNFDLHYIDNERTYLQICENVAIISLYMPYCIGENLYTLAIDIYLY